MDEYLGTQVGGSQEKVGWTCLPGMLLACGNKAVWMLEVGMKGRVQTAGLVAVHEASGLSAEVQPLAS